MKQKLELLQQPRLKTLILETQGVTLELVPGSFGYFSCYGCDSECQSMIEWDKIFCIVCPKGKAGTCDKPK
jgi:hypothetical protein